MLMEENAKTGYIQKRVNFAHASAFDVCTGESLVLLQLMVGHERERGDI